MAGPCPWLLGTGRGCLWWGGGWVSRLPLRPALTFRRDGSRMGGSLTACLVLGFQNMGHSLSLACLQRPHINFFFKSYHLFSRLSWRIGIPKCRYLLFSGLCFYCCCSTVLRWAEWLMEVDKRALSFLLFQSREAEVLLGTGLPAALSLSPCFALSFPKACFPLPRTDGGGRSPPPPPRGPVR